MLHIPIRKMFNLMKKKNKDEDKERKKSREEKKKCSPEELNRLEEVRRSYFGKKKRDRRDKSVAELAEGDECDGKITNCSVKERVASYSGHSDSSDNSLNSLTRSPEELTSKRPPVPPRPPKRGILKGKPPSQLDLKPNSLDDDNTLVKNTLANELIVYRNVPLPPNVSPSENSLSKSFTSSVGSPSLSRVISPQTPVGEGLGGSHRSKTFELELRLPNVVPAKPPKVRSLTIYRQASGDFGFSLRRAAIPERVATDELERKRTIIFAEPSSIGHNETGLLPGDQLLEVNNVSVEGKTREEIVELVKSSSDRVFLKVQPVPELSELTRRLAIDGQDVELDETRIKTGTLTRSGSRRFKKDLAKSEDQLATERAWLEAEQVWLVHIGGFAGARYLKAGEVGSPLINGQVKVKLDFNGEVIAVDEDDVEKANPPQFDRAEDLSQLHFLNECSMLHTLRQRYGSNLIHTYAGSSMVVINPLHPLAIYSEKVIQMFKGCKQEDMPPHIYAVAQTAYRNMIASSSNQSIVFMGRSGSGKTANFRHVLHYLAYISGSVNKIVTVEKLNAISTLLEAFGNSRTVMNTNATRFTEMFSLDFDHAGQIVNASIQVLMLEKTRVVRRPEGEPTFHIFYQLLSGIDDKLRKELMLENLTESNLFMTPLQRLEDKQKANLAWIRIQAAMELLNIQSDEAKAIWYVLAAIYHLGVAGASKGTGSNKAQFCNPRSAQRAAHLLGIGEEDLARSIFQPSNSSVSTRASFRTSPSEKTNVNDKPTDAIDALEGMVLGLYYEAFNVLLALINRQISSTLRSVSSILIVDSPGFQNPASCGRLTGATFEDLCYNYSQERLQLLFHENIFVAQQDRYAQEQIECNLETFQSESSSPSQMVNLIDKPSQQSLIRSSNLDLRSADQRGLLWLLDEEAIFPGSTDESFLDRLFVHYNERDHKQLLVKGKQPTQFMLYHLMGTNPVTYNATGWLKACRENPVFRVAATLLQDSLRDTISKLFLSCRGPITTTISGSVVSIEGTSSIRRASSLRRGYNTSTAGIKRRSVCLQVKFQEDGVIETLRRTKIHFVHCMLPHHNAGLCDLKSSSLMPNKQGSSDDSLLNVPLLRSQLRGNQILDAVRTHKQGFPEHLLFSEFRYRFELLAPVGSRSSSPILDERQAVEKILQHLDIDRMNYRLGLSKIFIRPVALSQLEEQRDEKIQDTIIKFQAYCRGYLGRQKLQKMKVQDLAIRCIQRNVNKFLAIRSWPWWRLMVKVLPLLNVHRTEEELRNKEQELLTVKTKQERLEHDYADLKHEKSKLEAKLGELTADLAEEHSTSTHATEMLEVETSERMRLEKDLKELEMKHQSLLQQHEQMEMEIMEARMFRATEMNGDILTDDEPDSSVYKQKYERACREMEFAKKRFQQLQEDEQEKQFVFKKQFDRKLAETMEEVEEHRQTINQWKRKVQRLTSELNDVKLLLDEQNARNVVLEKKQRKFDSDLNSAQDEVKQEKVVRDRIQREKEQIQGEKFTMEQEIHAFKLELEMKEEKIAALTKELDDLTFDTKGDEEIALMKRAKHELEVKVRDQEEELDDQAGQLQLLEQARLRLEMNMDQIRKEHKKELQQKDEESEEFRRLAQKRVKALEEQLEMEHDERQALIKEKHELERRIIDLQERPAPHNHDVETIHRLKRDLKRTKALLRDAQTMLEHAKEDAPSKVLIRQLKNQLEDAEFAKTAAIKAKQSAELELQDVQAQYEDLTRLKSELEHKCATLVRERNDYQAQQEENEEEMAEVMKKYKAAVQQQSFLQTQLADQAGQFSEIELERNLLKDQLSDLRGKLEVLEGETLDTQTQRRLEHRVKEVESRLELEETTKSRLEVQLHRIKEQNDKLNLEYDNLRAHEQQMQDVNRKLQRQLREFKEDYGELQQRENEIVMKKKEMELAMDNVEAENQSLRSDLKLAFKRIEDLQAAMTDNLGSDSNASPSGSDDESDSSLETFLRNHRQRPLRSRLGSSGSSASISSSTLLGQVPGVNALDCASRVLMQMKAHTLH